MSDEPESLVDAMLAEAARKGPSTYYEAAIKATRAIHERLCAQDKLTSCVVGNDVSRLKELLRVSVVLNDCTSVVFDAPGALKVRLPERLEYHDMFGTDNLRFNLSRESMEANGIDIEMPLLRPCFIYSESVKQRPLMAATASFIESGSVVFQPSRAVLAKKVAANSWTNGNLFRTLFVISPGGRFQLKSKARDRTPTPCSKSRFHSCPEYLSSISMDSWLKRPT